MKMLYRKQYGSKEISGDGFIQWWNLSNNVKQLNTFQIFHEEVNILIVRKGLNKAYNVRELYFLKYFPLLFNVIFESFLLDRFLRDLF